MATKSRNVTEELLNETQSKTKQNLEEIKQLLTENKMSKRDRESLSNLQELLKDGKMKVEKVGYGFHLYEEDHHGYNFIKDEKKGDAVFQSRKHEDELKLLLDHVDVDLRSELKNLYNLREGEIEKTTERKKTLTKEIFFMKSFLRRRTPTKKNPFVVIHVISKSKNGRFLYAENGTVIIKRGISIYNRFFGLKSTKKISVSYRTFKIKHIFDKPNTFPKLFQMLCSKEKNWEEKSNLLRTPWGNTTDSIRKKFRDTISKKQKEFAREIKVLIKGEYVPLHLTFENNLLDLTTKNTVGKIVDTLNTSTGDTSIQWEPNYPEQLSHFQNV